MTFQSLTVRNIRRAFTLVELITAMAITAILVVVIMQLTNQGVALWKSIHEDTSTSAAARMALQTISQDLESIQLRSSSGDFQWLYAEVDEPMRGMPDGLSIPKSARCIFYACAPDRNPSVSATSSKRAGYRTMLASDSETQGDVSAIAYRLKFRDHILNLPSRRGDTESFPLFSLYRQVVSPRDTYERIMGSENLETRYAQFEPQEDDNFLCENIVELNLIFNVEYSDPGASGSSDVTKYKTLSVPILSTAAKSGKNRFRLYSDYAVTEGDRMQNARILSAELSITVLTEEGVALVEQVRLGQRHAPELQEFFSRYTHSFSRSVALPQPL